MSEMLELAKRLRKANPYPEKVFPEPTSEQLRELAYRCREMRITLDRVSGSWGRRVWNNACDELEEILEEEQML